MPVKMIATRACYVPSKHMEVKPDQKFEAADDREADRLTRQKRAKRDVEAKKVSAPAPIARRNVLSLKDDAAAASDEKNLNTASGAYSRRDMRATED